MKTSPLAPTQFAQPSAIAGVTLAIAETAIRYQHRADLLLAAFDAGTQAAGVFTTSKVVAAPVTWCRSLLKGKKARALIVNAGNANAFTGTRGMASVKRVTSAVAKQLKLKPADVYIASTGVIGEPLADEKITAQLPALERSLGQASWHDAARAIMTTDTFFKVAGATTAIDGVPVRISGIAKGSGMIAPNMATLLAFVFTDAAIPATVLQSLLAAGADQSFNAITVDGDSSTNDTLLAFATGKATHKAIRSAQDPRLKAFKTGLNAVLTDLAVQVVKDGEGAQKLITITVKGAKSDASARKIALTIANSPLVKTAIAGQDANWGRIVAAAGRAGEPLVQEKIRLSIGGVRVAEKGARVAQYDEAPVNAHMQGRDIQIALDLGLGKGTGTVYTCDLTHGYIDINGSYRS